MRCIYRQTIHSACHDGKLLRIWCKLHWQPARCRGCQWREVSTQRYCDGGIMHLIAGPSHPRGLIQFWMAQCDYSAAFEWAVAFVGWIPPLRRRPLRRRHSGDASNERRDDE